MSHEIFLKFSIEYHFFCSTHGFNIELYDILKNILQIVHIANWCTWLAPTLCKGLIWNYKNCWAQLWLSLGYCKHFDEVENVSGIFFTDTGFCSEILKYALFLFLALVDDTPWWKISLSLGLKKMANILQITFSNGFSLKKITVFLSVCLPVCLSLSVCAFHTFFTVFPSWYHHEIFISHYQWQKWCLCKSSRSEVKSQG